RDVAKHKNLQVLGLQSTKITDAGLRELVNLRLYHLYLDETLVKDLSAAELGKLTHLKSLYIPNTRVTDGNVKELVKLQNLELLVINSDISKSALTELRKKLPHCEIK